MNGLTQAQLDELIEFIERHSTHDKTSWNVGPYMVLDKIHELQASKEENKYLELRQIIRIFFSTLSGYPNIDHNFIAQFAQNIEPEAKTLEELK